MKSYYAYQVPIRYYNAPPKHVELHNGGLEVSDSPTLADLDRMKKRPFFDLRRWKELPHVALANLRPDVNTLRAFTLRYGVVSARNNTGICFVAPRDVLRFQDYLRRAWKNDKNVVDQMQVDETVQLRFYGRLGSARLTDGEDRGDVAITDLWTLIRVFFLQDKLAGRVRVCPIDDCPAPYFIAERKDQKYCSHPCAVRENVRRFRKRQHVPKTKRRKPKSMNETP